MNRNPVAKLEMAGGDTVEIELRPDEAPNTVASFIHLARLGCFDGHAIQRIVPGYVVDASYNAFGQEACKYLIDNESTSHGFPNHLPMVPGVIAMGGYGEMGIAGGEFFFPLAENERLTGNYPAFGVITHGWEVVKGWESLPTVSVKHPDGLPIEINQPAQPLVIRRVTVDTFGVDWPEPVKRPMAQLPPGW